MAAKGVLVPYSVQADEKDHASWWVTNYGLLEASTEILVPRAERVFGELAAAADKRANRYPKLVILDAEGNPFAMSLPDGSILLTRGALRICYRKVSKKIGDARLAFIMGHELAHLANDDFWHATAFDAVNLHGGEERGFAGVRERIKESVEDVAKREHQADAFGMLYMATAGYDPHVLLERKSFFDEWSAELDRLDVRSANKHPDPVERAVFLRTQLAAVADELDFFYFGVRLLQLGRFDDGLILLEQFRGRFPGREVFNNIGFAELALALAHLGACDESELYRFKLPVEIDPDTLAAKADVVGRVPRSRSAGSTVLQCTESPGFTTHWNEALRSFRLARDRDPSYLPARQNLISTLLIAGRGTAALNEANEALLQAPNDPAIQMLKAIALYLAGQENDVDTVDTAVDTLNRLRQNDGPSIEVAYNLARILVERERIAAGLRAWRDFLSLESEGHYAEQAKQWIEIAPRPDSEAPRASADSLPTSPIPLGSLVRDIRTEDMAVQEIRKGKFHGILLNAGRIKALAIDNVIEIVQVDSEEHESPSQAYGLPERTHRGLRAELSFYPGLMVEWSETRTRKEVFFVLNRDSAK